VEVEVPLISGGVARCGIAADRGAAHRSSGADRPETAQRVLSTWRNCVFLASSDFTHYGPAYRFTPAGIGGEALAWAKQNDVRVLRLITDLRLFGLCRKCGPTPTPAAAGQSPPSRRLSGSRRHAGKRCCATPRVMRRWREKCR